MKPPPYPVDTRAKGWRFELDYERIEQSDTWSLAAEVPMAQPALLMMWLVAWMQVPCGSLPNDEAVIRAKCRVPAKVWPSLRDMLMRGWWLADDGRLYHDTIVQRVHEMRDYRKKNADRVAAFKAAKREQQVGNALPAREQPDSNDTGTGTGTGTNIPSSPSAKKETRKRAAQAPCVASEQLLAAGFTLDLAVDFIAHKAAMKAPLTPRAWADHQREAAKAGWSAAVAAEKVIARNWRGFEARYVAGEPSGRIGGTVNKQEAQEQRNRAVGDEWLRQQETADAAR